MLVGTTNTVLTISVVIAALGVLVAGIGVVWYVIQQRTNTDTTESDDARTEALALADTRGKRIDDLQADIDRLKKDRSDDHRLYEQQLGSLREQVSALEQRIISASRDFAIAQSLTARATIDLVVRVTEQLETEPPRVADALTLLRSYTSGQQPVV